MQGLLSLSAGCIKPVERDNRDLLQSQAVSKLTQRYVMVDL